MFVKMTARVAKDKAKFKKWTSSNKKVLLDQLDNPTDLEIDVIDDFVLTHEKLGLLTTTFKGYSGYTLIDDNEIVYSCTIWKNEETYQRFTVKNEKQISEAAMIRKEFLDIFKLFVVEPITFEVQSIDEITLDLVETKYKEFIGEV